MLLLLLLLQGWMMLSIRVSVTASRDLARAWVYPCFKHISLVSFSMSRKGFAKLAVQPFHPTSTPPTLLLIHWPYGEKCPTQNQCDDICSTQSTLHRCKTFFLEKSCFIHGNLAILFMSQNLQNCNHQVHEGHCVNTPPFTIPTCTGAPAATQWLSPRTFATVVPSESPPTTKPLCSQLGFEKKNLSTHQTWNLLEKHKEPMENTPSWFHFLRWKCTKIFTIFIDPSDKARIPASWVHPKVKHAIPEIQRNFLGGFNKHSMEIGKLPPK